MGAQARNNNRGGRGRGRGGGQGGGRVEYDEADGGGGRGGGGGGGGGGGEHEDGEGEGREEIRRRIAPRDAREGSPRTPIIEISVADGYASIRKQECVHAGVYASCDSFLCGTWMLATHSSQASGNPMRLK